MAMTHTLTGNIADLGLDAFAASKVTAWIELANVNDDTFLNVDDNTIVMGSYPLTINTDGSWSQVLPATGAGAGYDPDGGYFYELCIDARGSVDGIVSRFRSQPFGLTADNTIVAALEGTVELTAVSAAEWADFTARYDEIVALGVTNDSITAANIEDEGSDTYAALSATYVRPRMPLASGVTQAAPQPIVNVRDAGAKSDAESFAYDSTGPIQDAIDYCWEKGGGTVVIPCNTDPEDPTYPNRNSIFRAGTLEMKEGVHLTGDGPTMFGSTLIGNANGDMILFNRDSSQLPGSNYVLPCSISWLRLYGYPSATSGHGINTKDPDGTLLSLQHGVSFHHLVLQNFVNNGMMIWGGSGVSDVSQILGYMNGGYGVHLKGATVQTVNLMDIWGDGNHAGAALCIEDTIAGYAINIVGLKSEQIENTLRGTPGSVSQPNALHLKNVAGAVNINGLQHISSTNNTVRPGDGIVISGAARPKSIVVAGHSIRTEDDQLTGAVPQLLRDTTPAGSDITVPHETSLVVYGDNPVNMGRATVIETGPDSLTTGQESVSRDLANNASTLTSGRLRMSYFTARKSETITKLRTVSGTAAAATPTLCRVGLYTVASNGDLTLVASTPNTTTLWAAASTGYETATSASYDVVAGSRYCVVALCVTGAAAPTVGAAAAGPTADVGKAPRIAGLVDGQTDLPSTITAATVQDSSNRPYVVMLP